MINFPIFFLHFFKVLLYIELSVKKEDFFAKNAKMVENLSPSSHIPFEHTKYTLRSS